MSYHTTKYATCQDEAVPKLDILTPVELISAEFLNHKEVSERFAPKRKCSVLLSDSFARLGKYRKSERVKDCGTFLEFRKSLQDLSDNKIPYRLSVANFCRERLCPMCAWRRSLKIFGQVSKIMDEIENKYSFIFLTLTVPNCPGDDLSSTIDKLHKGFHKLFNYKRVKTACCGFFRALEVTRNKDPNSKSFGTYHPHFHIIIAVHKRYFKSKEYIVRDDWLHLWQKAMQDYSISQVDVRRVKPKDFGSGADLIDGVKLSAAVAEAAKYTVKSSDYIFENNNKLTDEIVCTLSAALFHRRLAAFGGCFEDVRNQLGLDDCEDGDLVHVDSDDLRPDLGYMIRRYKWSAGVYKLTDYNVEFECDDEN